MSATEKTLATVPIVLDPLSFGSQAANTLLMGPPSGNGNATFRFLSTPSDYVLNVIPWVTCKDNSTRTVASTTSETVLWACQIPAGALGTSGIASIHLVGDYLHNGAADADKINYNLKFGCSGTSDAACAGGATMYGPAPTSGGSETRLATPTQFRIDIDIIENDATNSQTCSGVWQMGVRTNPTNGFGVVGSSNGSPFFSTDAFRCKTVAINAGVVQYLILTATPTASSASEATRVYNSWVGMTP